VDHNGMAEYLPRSYCEGFYEVLYIQCSRWDWWWHIVEWQWGGWECLEWVWGIWRHWLWRWKHLHWRIKAN